MNKLPLRFLVTALIVLSLSNCSVFHKKSKPQFRLVQSGISAKFDGKKLIINNTAPGTVYFANHPYRIISHIDNRDLLKIWKNKKDQKDELAKAPNVAISFYDKNNKANIVIARIGNFDLGKNYISYDVLDLFGKLPKDMKNITIFIDSN